MEPGYFLKIVFLSEVDLTKRNLDLHNKIFSKKISTELGTILTFYAQNRFKKRIHPFIKQLMCMSRFRRRFLNSKLYWEGYSFIFFNAIFTIKESDCKKLKTKKKAGTFLNIKSPESLLLKKCFTNPMKISLKFLKRRIVLLCSQSLKGIPSIIYLVWIFDFSQ